MTSLFPGYNTHIEVTQENIDTYYQKLNKFTHEFKDFILTFCTDLYAYSHYNKYPEEIKQDIETLFSQKDLYDNFMSNKIQEKDIKSSILKDFLFQSFGLIIPRKDIPEAEINFKSLQHEISADKAQQTHLFFQYVKNETQSLNPETTTFLDLGAGKGYLSAYVAFDMKRKIISVEASEKHGISLARRVCGLTSKFYNDIYQQIQGKLQSADQDYDNLRIAITMIDTAVDGTQVQNASQSLSWFYQNFKNKSMNEARVPLNSLNNNIQGVVAKSIQSASSTRTKDETYVPLGLHACGDLSVIALKMLLHSDVSYAFTVPCCYIHLSDNYFPLHKATIQPLENLHDEFYPVTRKISSHKISEHVLRFAGTGFDEKFEDLNLIIQQFFDRAVLDKCRTIKGLNTKTVAIKRTGTFTEWVQQQLIKENVEMNTEEINKIYEECEQHKWAMKAHLIFRKIAGQVLESMILVDRYMWLRNNNFQGKIDWCMGGYSGRGFVLWGKKISQQQKQDQ
ncbi:Methyltransferase_domain-containing protein [Hexamita inflata]|uniref:Methyltransferase domain-containing protein n=1 Tax=Hexamita inflata TaxID=28002 RepID=A0AA86RRT5_9EUKA|nr:Methyltransferase domain-containing protein [Hexamita inflata]